MRDNLQGPDGNIEWPSDKTPAKPGAPLSDREVPLPKRGTPPAVHAWLDGEVAESSLRQSDMGRHVDFWKQITMQAEARRQVRTPTHLEARIMAALPEAAPSAHVTWWERSVEVTFLAVLLGGGALIALGASLATAFLR